MSGAPQRRLDNIRHAQELLARASIAFEPRNNGAALIVEHNGLRVEFAPGTSRWQVIGTAYEARGVKELIRFLTERPGPKAGLVSHWWYGGDAQETPGLYEVHVGMLDTRARKMSAARTIWRPIEAMPGRWARALNPLTGRVL